MSKTLVIALGAAGDVIDSSALIHSLGEHGAGGADPSTVDVVVLSSMASLVEGTPGLGRVVTFDPRTVEALDARIGASPRDPVMIQSLQQVVHGCDLTSYDRVVNLSYASFACLLAACVGGKERRGGILDERGRILFLGNEHVYLAAMLDHKASNFMHLVDLYRASDGNGSFAKHDSRLHVPQTAPAPAASGPTVIIYPGGVGAGVAWATDYFAQVCDGLAAAGVIPVVVGTDADRDLCNSVAIRAQAEVRVCTATAFDELAQLIVAGDALIANDTAIGSYASAVGTKVVTVCFDRDRVRQTAPWGAGHVILDASGRATNTVEMVLAATLWRIGLANDVVLRQALTAAKAGAWETMFLPQDADPLGGIAYRPLHRPQLSWDEVGAMLFRHAFGWWLSGTRGATSPIFVRRLLLHKDLSQSPGWEKDRDAWLMAAEAISNRCLDLAKAVRIARRTNGAAAPGGDVQKVADYVRAHVDSMRDNPPPFESLRLGIGVLSWKIRMLPEVQTPATLAEYEMALFEGAAFTQMARTLAVRFTSDPAMSLA